MISNSFEASEKMISISPTLSSHTPKSPDSKLSTPLLGK